MSTSREAFECYIRSISGFKSDFQVDCNGAYKSDLMNVMLLTWQEQQKQIDELQARLDEAIKWVEDNKKSIPLSEWHGYTTEEYVDADDLLDILKIEQAFEGSDK